MTSPEQEIAELASYVAGYADSEKNDKLRKAAKWLEILSRNICGGGMVGCRGGKACTSDHK